MTGELREWMSCDRTLQILGKVNGAAWAIAILFLGWMALSLGLEKAAHSEAARMLDSESLRLAEASATLESSEDDDNPLALPDNSLAALRSEMEAAAGKAGCVLSEFRSGSTPAPFVTNFSQETEASDWLQLDVKIRVEGSALAVQELIGSLSRSSLPIEINSLEMQRGQLAEGAGILITALIDLRLLLLGESS